MVKYWLSGPRCSTFSASFVCLLPQNLAILPNAILLPPVASREQSGAEDDPSAPLKTVAEGERLVRIPLEELQQGNVEKQ